MPIKEADKVRNQVLALLDTSAVEQYIAQRNVSIDPRTRIMDYGANAVREYAEYLRRQLAQGPTDSSFTVC